ncbi:MAG TPA: hypothetical protein VFI54_06300 [Solirubrobacteraceae bacterium]|nr:hypothetical protein [Solirubrobacteraceae bacterium]
MSPAEMVRSAWRSRSLLAQEHIVHAIVVIIVLITATVYADTTQDRSGNVWIVYGSAIGYAAGRSGSRSSTRRDDDED